MCCLGTEKSKDFAFACKTFSDGVRRMGSLVHGSVQLNLLRPLSLAKKLLRSSRQGRTGRKEMFICGMGHCDEHNLGKLLASL